jgi:uncharacterized protein YjbI with pentapeptide repeats
MRRADLTHCDLAGADLAGADLTEADLSYASLAGASLAYATLTGAVLTDCDLTNADLHGADLTRAALHGVRLAGARLDEALWSKTSVARCADLAAAIGLERARIGDDSSLDVQTLRANMGALSDAALAPFGLTAAEHAGLRGLFAPA